MLLGLVVAGSILKENPLWCHFFEVEMMEEI